MATSSKSASSAKTSREASQIVHASAEEESTADPFQDPFEEVVEHERHAVKHAASAQIESDSTQPPSDGSIELEEPPAGEEPAPLELPERQPPATGPSLEQELAQGPVRGPERCPSPNDLKRIHEITNDISPEEGAFPQECPLGDEGFTPRAWPLVTYTWKASGLCHKPLYFEEVALERYGHSLGPLAQPIISGAHFFGTVPILPYKMGMVPPWECVYPLGYYRPGSCAPYTIGPIPISLRGALVEGGVVTGMVFLIP